MCFYLMSPSGPRYDACIACGTRLGRIVLDREDCRVRACDDCGLGVLEPASYVSQSSYDGSDRALAGYAQSEPLNRVYARKVLDGLERHGVAATGRLLDVGCSVGLLVDEARGRGFYSEGIDLDRAAVDYARGQRRNVSVARIEDWASRDYSVIVLKHTLEHAADPLSFLRSCRDRLASGGVLCVAVPCHRGLHPRVFGRRWYGWQPEQHYFHWTRRSLCLVTAAAGLRPVAAWQDSMDHFFMIDRRLRALSRVKRTVMWGVAAVGAMVGMGDQLHCIARR